MTIAYNDIADLVAAGRTPEQIAALLAVRTVRPLLIADLENYVFQQGIARRNGITGAWQGPLIDAMQNDQFPAELRAGIEELMSFVNNRTSVSIDTTKEPRASQNAALLPGLLQTGVLTERQVGEILAMAGGYRYPGLTAQSVQALIDNQAKQQIIDAGRQAIAAQVSPWISKKNAINAWLDSYEIADKTAAEVQAYVDALLASDNGNPPTEGGE